MILPSIICRAFASSCSNTFPSSWGGGWGSDRYLRGFQSRCGVDIDFGIAFPGNNIGRPVDIVQFWPDMPSLTAHEVNFDLLNDCSVVWQQRRLCKREYTKNEWWPLAHKLNIVQRQWTQLARYLVQTVQSSKEHGPDQLYRGKVADSATMWDRALAAAFILEWQLQVQQVIESSYCSLC